MPLLLAISRQRTTYSVHDVLLTRSVQDDVQQEFLRQETAFRSDSEERSFDQNWQLDPNEIATTPATGFDIFRRISELTDTTVAPLPRSELEGVRGLAIRIDGRILVQKFGSTSILSRSGLLALAFRNESYTRLEPGAFRLADKLLCIVENDLLKFKSLHALGGLLDTSTIFNEATDAEVESFVAANHNLFHFGETGGFLSNANRNARKYISSILASRALSEQNVTSLRAAMEETGLHVVIRDRKIAMPTDSRKITEIMRFLNDGRYVGPVSGATYITNSRRIVSN